MGQNKHIDLFKEMIPSVDMGFKDLWDAATDDTIAVALLM